MSEIGNEKRLFAEFPPISTQDWVDKIVKDLKGADYERSLVWQTNEGFKVRPFYRSEDIDKLGYLDGQPSVFPFVRGNQCEKNNWFIRQDIAVNSFADANKKALLLLTKGINAIGFVLDSSKQYSEADIAGLLKSLPINQIEVSFEAGKASASVAKAIVAYLKNNNINPATTNIALTYDPITGMAADNSCFGADSFDNIAEIINLTKHVDNFNAVTVRADIIENAGSSIVQELGFALAIANEYMAKLTEKGIPADNAAKTIKFRFAIGGNYFMEIAKIRAARLLWAQIVKQYNPQNNCSAKANIHAVTSQWNKTIYDPYVNLLRTQTESMSAVLAGVNSLTVNPFNTTYEQPTDFSERIARNQQILLKEEAHFDKVVDPGAGSYFIENLTDSIAEQAWKLFIEVEDKGGAVEALKTGFIQQQVAQMAQKRDMDLANRKEILLGVNQYPNFNEHIDKNLDTKLFNKPVINTSVEPFIPYRGAMAFELLRYKTDTYSKNNKRPLAFMLTCGNLTMRKARAQFASNFFAVAGFDVMDNNGFDTIEQGIEAAKQAKADIVVICSSDDEYATLAPQVKKLCTTQIPVVAGFPKAIMDNLKAEGLEHFIHVKSNVLDTLTGFQKLLGI